MNVNSGTNERRSNSTLYIDPTFRSTLHDKNIASFLSTYTANNATRTGSQSLSRTITIGGTKYIIRVTPFISYAQRMSTENEIHIYQRLKQDPKYKMFISNLLYADSYKAVTKPESIFLFEHEPGQVLDEFIKQYKGRIGTDFIMSIYNHLDAAIDFLASNQVVHRDIKPENIYMSFSRNIPLLFDFDTSCTLGKDCKAYQFTGSPKYATPNSTRIRYQIGFTKNTQVYTYSPIYDKYSLAVLLEHDLSKLAATDVEREEIQSYAKYMQGILVAKNSNQQDIQGGYSRVPRYTTRKQRHSRMTRKQMRKVSKGTRKH